MVTESCAIKAPPISELQSESDAILYEVARLRGLEVIEPVPVKVISRQELKPILENIIAEDINDRQMENDARLYRLLGLIPGEYDLEKAVLGFYDNQVAAFYDPYQDEMNVVTPLRLPFFSFTVLAPGSEGMIRKLMISHELVHALDDQHFGLERFTRRECGNQDHLLAIQAVTEGSAIFFSVMYIMEREQRGIEIPWDRFSSKLEKASSREIDKSAFPEVVLAPAFFSYDAGLKFVLEVYKQGGTEAINDLYSDESLSTENILHPISYIDGMDLPVDVKISAGILQEAAPPPIEEEYQKLCEDTMGEFGAELILHHFMPQEKAQDAARGWAGDSYQLWGNSERDIFIWQTIWDSNADAEEFYKALLDMLKVKYPDLKNIEVEEKKEHYTSSKHRASVTIKRDRDSVLLFEVKDI